MDCHKLKQLREIRRSVGENSLIICLNLMKASKYCTCT